MINTLKPYMPTHNFFIYQVGKTSFLPLIINDRAKNIQICPFAQQSGGQKRINKIVREHE